MLLATAALLAAMGLLLFFPTFASAYLVERAGRMLDVNPSSVAAEAALRKAVEWNRGNAQAYRLLAGVQEQQGDWQAAAAAWAAFASLRPADPQGAWSLASACERVALFDLEKLSGRPCGNDEESRRQRLVELWEAAGQTAASFVRAAETPQAQGDQPQAVEWYQKALLIDPRSAPAWNGLAGAYRALGKNDLALEAYAQAAAFSPDPELAAAAHASRGELLAAEGKPTEAAAELAQAAGLAPDNGDYQLSYGWYLIQAGGDPETARTALSEAARLLRANPWPHVHLARLAYADGDYETALAEAHTAAGLDHGLFWAWLWRGKALARLGRLPEAEDSLRMAIGLTADAAAPHAEMGLFLAQQQRPGEAAAEWEQAVQLAPAEIGYRLGLAAAYRAEGQKEEAAGVYRQILEIDPANAEAKKALAELGH
jgi:tetratricopeptide (TPR) repeat protein